MKITCCSCSPEHIDNPDIWGSAAKLEVSPENAARLLHLYRWRLTEAGWECGIHRNGIPEGTA